jgi:predicted lipoprotein with Yx(FWY)xxD motif
MKSRLLMIALVIIAATAVMACSSGTAATASPAAPSVAASQAAPSVAASEAPPSEAGSPEAEATVEVTELTGFGPGLYAGENGLTVYTFTKDVKDSGKSACTGGCIDTWPALTVPAGSTPTGGSGVTGTLGTITRDDGTLQVTYNGLPLYFFKNDKAEGDTNGIYENWNAVKP